MKNRLLLAIAALAMTAMPGISQNRYADHSVLSYGRWAKIRIPETGIYTLSDELLRDAGFTDPSKVKVYGYGGALQPELLTADYIDRKSVV